MSIQYNISPKFAKYTNRSSLLGNLSVDLLDASQVTSRTFAMQWQDPVLKKRCDAPHTDGVSEPSLIQSDTTCCVKYSAH